MAKKQEQELEELKEQDSDVEEVEEQEGETTSKGTPSNDFKNVVITECNRIIDQYIEICKGNNDEAFLKALDNPDKTKENCVNHIMNNLTKKRIYGGADSLMYEFIHEYYVDDFTEVKDNWSNFMRNPSAISNNRPKKVKEENSTNDVDIEKIKRDAVAEYKAAEKAKKEEAKLKAEEEKKRKEAEAKKKEEEANQNLGGLFDLL